MAHIVLIIFLALVAVSVAEEYQCSLGSQCGECVNTYAKTDILIVGAGIAGLESARIFRNKGYQVVVLEQGSDVGGTWFWNRYPGAKVDFVVDQYHLPSIRKEWNFTHDYAAQPELEKHILHYVDKFSLRELITFNTNVTEASWNQEKALWTVKSSAGDCWTSDFVILATGILSVPHIPQFPDLDKFKGQVYSTHRYPKDAIDLTGKRVAVVGTGSSGVQTIPAVAKIAESVTVFQKTAQWVWPIINNPRTLETEKISQARHEDVWNTINNSPLGFDSQPTGKIFSEYTREEFRAELQRRYDNGGFELFGISNDILMNRNSDDLVREFLTEKILNTVKDPNVAKMLVPTIPYVCKRPLVHEHYYQTYNRENVKLHSLRDAPIVGFTSDGILTSDGKEHKADVLILATGFDLFATLFKINIRGISGKLLSEKLSEHWDSFLGLSAAEFPNMFFIGQGGTPTVLSNVIVSEYQQLEYVSDLLSFMKNNGKKVVRNSVEDDVAWRTRVETVGNVVLFTTKDCNSHYLGSNIPGKPRRWSIFAEGFIAYRQKLNEIRESNFSPYIFE